MSEEKGVPARLIPRTPEQRARDVIRIDREAGTHRPGVVGETMKRPILPKPARSAKDELHGIG